MHTTLIESKRRPSRGTGGTAASVVAHAALITLLAAATANANDYTPAAPVPPPDIIYVPVSETPPAQRGAAPQPAPAHAIPQTAEPPARPIDPPVDIPTTIPKVDLSNLAADPTDFLSTGRSGSDAIGVGAPSSRGAGGTFTTWQVEKEASPLPGNPKPRYPSLLESARVDGEVLAQFVVDTLGSVDMSTFRAIHATDALFVEAVRRALARWKFQPAEVGGHNVRQLVQMPLTFTVR